MLEEAEDIFYSMNCLRYPVGRSVPSYHGPQFLQSLSTVRRNAMRHVVFSTVSASQALDTITTLRTVTNIETLKIERTQSIRYMDVGSWKLLKKQLIAALTNFKHLRKLEIVTPSAKALNLVEEQQMRDLDAIDVMLQVAVSRPQQTGGNEETT